MSPSPKLHNRMLKQQEVLNIVAEYMMNNAVKDCATVKELSEELGYSKQTTLKYLKALTLSGDLVRDNEIPELFWLNVENS